MFCYPTCCTSGFESEVLTASQASQFLRWHSRSTTWALAFRFRFLRASLPLIGILCEYSKIIGRLTTRRTCTLVTTSKQLGKKIKWRSLFGKLLQKRCLFLEEFSNFQPNNCSKFHESIVEENWKDFQFVSKRLMENEIRGISLFQKDYGTGISILEGRFHNFGRAGCSAGPLAWFVGFWMQSNFMGIHHISHRNR